MGDLMRLVKSASAVQSCAGSENERHEQLQERVQRAVQELQGLARGASLSFALGVGRVVIETLYDGDLSAWRGRGRKDHALRVLAARRDLPVSASALYRALAVYELSRCLGDRATSSSHLGLSHLRAVLGLSPDTQQRLLKLADDERWTVARLEREASCVRPGARPHGGRRPVPAYIKSIRRIFQLTSPDALQGLEDWTKLETAELEQLTSQLAQARDRLERLEQILPRSADLRRSARRLAKSA